MIIFQLSNDCGIGTQVEYILDESIRPRWLYSGQLEATEMFECGGNTSKQLKVPGSFQTTQSIIILDNRSYFIE